MACDLTLKRLARGLARLAATLVSTAFLAVAAPAATVSVLGVTGSWVSATPGNTTNLTGLGTDTLSWGAGHPAGGFRHSGYMFTGSSALPVTLVENQSFVLGQFTHNNWTIANAPAPYSITSASLQLTFDLQIGGASQNFTQVYDFLHWETPNDAQPCANGGGTGVGVNANGCADRVQAVLNKALSQTFHVGATDYYINISAFQGFSRDTHGVPTFWTVENRTNTANLLASFRAVDAPAPVSLPGAAGLLLTGMAGLGAARRRRA